MNQEKIDLWGLTLSELSEVLLAWGFPKFAPKQVAQWLYQKRVSTFQEMTNLSLAQREILEARATLGLVAPVKVDVSQDGTKKYLFPAGNSFVEAAYLPEETRHTLCLSSQVGCKMGCLFCMTGKQGFQSNLTSGQILNQIRSLPEGPQLTHLVYMGMGEPLDNLENVLKSLEILTAPWGFGMSPKKITVSTVGVRRALEEFFQRTQVRFALSLHTPFLDQRRDLMPVEQVYSALEILDFLKTLPPQDDRRLSIEYICFAGVNDTPAHAKELVRILHGLKTRVNLIPFHPIPGSPLKGSSPQAMETFRNLLNQKGILATVRRSRGLDILAACGLLSTKAKQPKILEDF